MSANPITKNNAVSVETAASWNARYATPGGFVCQLTLRGETVIDLLEKAIATLPRGFLHQFHSNHFCQGSIGRASPSAQIVRTLCTFEALLHRVLSA